jgi:5-methylcytosine rRNA methyltransferase NSUN4
MGHSEAFDAYYQAIYGDRWVELHKALLQPRRHVARITSLGRASGFTSALPEIDPGCLDVDHPDVQAVYDQYEGHLYLMDLASVIAARNLRINPETDIWDACAAPGGKTLILLETLNGSGSLTAGDLSRARCGKMKRILESHSTEAIRSPLRIVACDSVNWGYRHQNQYDAVMLDAPCSSERHVITDPKALSQWSEKRVKTLVTRQYALLCSALLACNPGGEIVYSTCSINPAENDELIERYISRKPDTIEVLETHAKVGRSTKYGWTIMPDLDDGWGPIYFARLKRRIVDSS